MRTAKVERSRPDLPHLRASNMKTRPRRRAPGNVTPSALVRIDLAKQRLFSRLVGERKVCAFKLANETGLKPTAVREELKRLGWKRSTAKDSLEWFLP